MKKPAQLTLTSVALIAGVVLTAGYLTHQVQAQLTSPTASPSGSTPLVQPLRPTASAAATLTASPAAAVSQPTPTPDPLVLTTAQNNEMKLTATPVRIGDDNSLLLKPGEKKQVTLKVYNNSSTATKIITLAEDFVIGEDGATPQPVDVTETNNRWSLKKWLTIVPNSQTIKAGETGVVSVLIEVPADALPGGHYAMVMHQPDLGKDAANDEEKSTVINQRVGTLLYVVVDGPIYEEAFIRDLYIPQFQELGPVPYSFVFDNDSDTHLQPKLTFNVYNIWGKRIYSEAVESKNIFPKDSRTFDQGVWERIWGFGRYKGEVVAVYGSQSATKMLSTTFWLFPLKLVLAIGVAVITFIGIFIAIRRHMIHRSQDQTKRVRELEETVARMEQEKTNPPQVNE